jgi:DNA-binding MarR family transcriptional regulator
MAKVKLEQPKLKYAKLENVGAENLAPRPKTLAAADRLHSTAIHLLRSVRQQDITSGVGPAQLSALSVLVFAGTKTLGALAAAEQVRPPTMSRIVAGLKRRGLIQITRDPHDTRRMHIRTTAAGTRLLQQARRRRVEALAGLLSLLTSEELARVSQAVEILRKSLGTPR